MINLEDSCIYGDPEGHSFDNQQRDIDLFLTVVCEVVNEEKKLSKVHQNESEAVLVC